MSAQREQIASAVRFEWHTALTTAHRESLQALLNAVLAGENVIGFPAQLGDSEAQKYLDGLQLELQLGRKEMLLGWTSDQSLGAMVLLSRNAQANCRHWGEVSKCLIHPQHRGVGVLNVGLLQLIERCAQSGIEILTLDVRKGSRAEALWRRLGFEQFGQLGDYARVDGKVHAGAFMYASLETLRAAAALAATGKTLETR